MMLCPSRTAIIATRLLFDADLNVPDTAEDLIHVVRFERYNAIETDMQGD